MSKSQPSNVHALTQENYKTQTKFRNYKSLLST